MLQFVGKGTFNNFFHCDDTLEFVYFLLGPLSNISVLLLQSIDFFIEGFLQGLSFLLTLTGGFGSEFISSLSDIFTVPPLSVNLCLKIFNILMGLGVINLQSVKLFAGVFQEFLGIDAVSNSLLIFPEEDIVFDFNIFGLGEAKLSNAEIVFQFGNFMFIAIDFSDIVLNIMTGWWFLVELAFGANGFESFLPAEIGAIRFWGTARKIFWVCVSSLGHNDNIIQIKLSMHTFIRVFHLPFFTNTLILKKSISLYPNSHIYSYYQKLISKKNNQFDYNTAAKYFTSLWLIMLIYCEKDKELNIL